MAYYNFDDAKKRCDLLKRYQDGDIDRDALLAAAPELATSLGEHVPSVPSTAEEACADEQMRMTEEQVQSLPVEQAPPIAGAQIQCADGEGAAPIVDEQIESANEKQSRADQNCVFHFTTLNLLDFIEQNPIPAAEQSAPPVAWSAEDFTRLLDDIAAGLRRHLVLPDGAAETTTLFVMHAHAHEAAQTSPLLAIISPEPGCGKTTVLDVLAALVPEPLRVADLTSAGLYRTISASKRTLLLDEAETALLGSSALVRLFNGGHSRGGDVLRADGTFSVWCPKAIALIGELPPTLRDRSLRIYLNRKHAHEVVAPLNSAAIADLQERRERAARWAAAHSDQLAAVDPVMPAGITNRICDNWRPLIAIADTATGNWPKLARDLALKAAEEAEVEESPRVTLLGHIRHVSQEAKADQLATANLINLLMANEQMPWAREWKNARRPDIQLAQLLHPFGIRPKTIRFGDVTAKGYDLRDFEDVFERYLKKS